MKTIAAAAAALALALVTTACMPDARQDGYGAEAARSSTTVAAVPTVTPPGQQPAVTSTNEALTIRLQELDKNGDRFITREELDANHRLMINFASYDTDNDGRISAAEFSAYVSANTQ